MSKKKPAPKSKPKPKARKAAKPAAKRAAKAATQRSPRPRAQTLPGMEQVRNVKLDRICEEIGDSRDIGNRLTVEEKKLKTQAAREMEAKGILAYRQNGVELKFSPGEPTLSVRLIKESTTKKRDTAETKEAEGIGQDAGEIGEALTEPEEEAEAADLEG